jgi:hypothetical protein
MKWQLTAPWPTAQAVIEPGTIIDGHDPQWLGVIMPFTVLCIDQEAADQMLVWYQHLSDRMHLHVRYSAGVNPKKKEN